MTESLRFSSLAIGGLRGVKASTTAGVYELVVFLWDGSVQRRVLPALRGRVPKSKGQWPAVPAEIHVPTGNPAGDGLYQPRTSQVAMLRRYTVRGERHLPPFLDARTHTHISPGLFPSPGRVLGCFEYRAIFDAVLVNAHKVQGLCVTGGGAGHQALQPFAH